MTTACTCPPIPRPRAADRVRRARELLREELEHVREIEHLLSAEPGVPPERRSDYWLGIISGAATWLLWALDAEDKANA